MDLTKARALVAEMATADVKGISFTAGEPLLYLNDLIALIRLCKKYGIYSRVVTNGFWAKTRQMVCVVTRRNGHVKCHDGNGRGYV